MGGVNAINYKAPGKCPVCGHGLSISRLTCHFCSTRLEGEFTSCKFCNLPTEQREFVEIFIKCRGNIKDVEKELGISYPTVRNRLDSAITALGYPIEKEIKSERTKNETIEVLDALERGDISASEATSKLKKRN